MTLCPYCSLKSYFFLNAKDDNHHLSEDVFEYYQCLKCKIIYLKNVPQDLSEHYPSNYYGPTPKTAEDLLGAAKIVEQYKIDLVKKFLESGELLEVGPSMGGFALLAKDAGFNVRTIEMNRICADYLNNVAKIKTTHTHDETSALSNEPSVDALCLWHVLEHLKDPFRFLEIACQKIKSGGMAVLALPNPESLQFLFFRERWVHLDAPRHVSLIPRNVLKEFFQSRGFKILLNTTLDEGSLSWNKFGWDYSPKKCESSITKLKVAAIKKLEVWSDKGSCYTIIAQKL